MDKFYLWANMASQIWPAEYGQPSMADQWWTNFTIGRIWPAKYDRHLSPTCILNCSLYGGQFLIVIDSRDPKDLSGTDSKFVTHFGCKKMAGQWWTSFTFGQIWHAKYGKPNMASQVWPAKFGQPNMASQIWPAKYGQPNLASRIWPAKYGQPNMTDTDHLLVSWIAHRMGANL